MFSIKTKNVLTSFTFGIGMIGIFYIVYLFYKHLRSESDDEEETDPELEGTSTFTTHSLRKLIANLDNNGETELVVQSLKQIADMAAFQECMALVRTFNGLESITPLIRSEHENIKIQAATAINNLAMDEQNHAVLRTAIPDLILSLKLSRDPSEKLLLALTRALTNLTTIDDNHQHVLPHLCVLIEVLQAAEHPIQLQILKTLVNLSTNTHMIETQLEVDMQLISGIVSFIKIDEDRSLLLRALTCLANIIKGLHKRSQDSRRQQVSASEFVNEKLQADLERLVNHPDQEIRVQAGKTLFALRPSVSDKSPSSLNDIDLVEVLKL